MRVLMITGDRRFGPGNPRYDVQKSAVEVLDVVYWGRSALIKPFFVKGTYDVVTAQDPLFRGLVAWVVSKRLGAKLNVQVHVDIASLSFFRHILAQIVLRHADSVRVVSEKIKKQVQSVGVKGGVSILPVFADIEKYKAITKKEHTGKNILWVGRFEEEKNPIYAVAVLKEVRALFPDAHLVLLGEGSERDALTESSEGLSVEMPGWQDPVSFLERADVVISTSAYESWGASMIEALAAGVPVVSLDVGIAREAGAIVVENKEKLADAVIEVLKNNTKGELRLQLLPAEAWAVQWRQSLI